MSDSMFDRAAASGGLAFAVLGLASAAVAPTPPDVDAPADQVRRYLSEHRGGFGASAILMALALVAVSLVFAYVHRRLVDTDGETAAPSCFLLAGSATVALALAGVLVQGVLARHSDTGLDDSTLLALHRVWHLFAFMGPPITIAVALLIAGERSIRGRLFAPWLGWVAIVSAVGGLVTALLEIGTSATAPAALDFGSFLLCCVFLSGVSVSALRRRESVTSPTVMTARRSAAPVES
jgi:hypothetical protein